MPQLKEITSIQTMTMDVFFKSVLQCCNRLSRMGDEALFRSGVIAIREAVYNRLPGSMMAEFANKFLDKFSLKTRSEPHSRIALEMIMDVEIVGLQLKGPSPSSGVLQHLNLPDGRRFLKLVELDLSPIIINHGYPMYRFLHTYHLNDLVTIKYLYYCTDRDLRTIGLNCPKSESVEVRYSKYVTDQGLRGLKPCSNLRVVHFRSCPKISHLGLDYLLSAHEKIENFYYGYDRKFKAPRIDGEVDPSTGLDLSVQAPFMSRLVIVSYRNDRPALNVQAVVTKFPNLVHLKINCEEAINLSAIKHLNKLTGLEVNFVNGMPGDHENLVQTWRHIEEILSTIGSNITTLTLCARLRTFVCRQEQLNLIFNCCPNLEQLQFDHLFGLLVVPEFEKLKVLNPRVSLWLLQSGRSCNLEFAKMPNLEVLSLPYELVAETIKSMMLDDDKFPKLSVLNIIKRRFSANDLEDIERIARDHNLNFRVEEFDESRSEDYPLSEYSFDGSDTDDYIEPSDWDDSDEDGDIIMENGEEVQ